MTLTKIIASEGKILVSKSKDKEGKYVVKAKEIYLAVGDSADNYEEISEVEAYAESNTVQEEKEDGIQ